LNTKRIIFWLFVGLTLFLGVYGYLQLRNTKKPQTDALQVMPDSCLVYFCTSDLPELEKRINQRNLIADKLRLFPAVQELFSALHYLDSIVSTHEEMRDQMMGSQFHAAVYPGDAWLLCFNIRELGHEQSCRDAIKTALSAQDQANYLSFVYQTKTVYCQLEDGILRLSPNLYLIDKCHTNGAKLAQQANFQKFKSTLSENKLLSLYVNQSLLQAPGGQLPLRFDMLVKNGSCTAGVELGASDLRINGFQAIDSTELLSAFLNEAAYSTEDLLSALPYTTAWFESYGYGHFQTLPIKPNETSTQFWKTVSDKALYNVKQELYENLSGTLTRFGSINSKTSVLASVVDSTRAEESLQQMSDSTWRMEQIFFCRLHGKQALSLFQPLIKEKISYAARWADQIYFSNDLIELQSVILACSKNRHMLNNEAFDTYRRQNLPEQYNYLVYTSPQQAEQGFAKLLNLKAPKELDPYENFKHLSYTLLHEKNYFKFRFHLLQENAEKQKNLLWTTVLDTVCTTKPWSFVNHTTNENEIVVQDEANHLYLINAKGAILWKKNLKEKILSDVHLVDIYKNGKFQMLFNTANEIHLIDRNGEYLPNFPIKLTASATAPLSLFDYDADKNYRVLIPCANKTIYNYTLEGKKLEGFSPIKTEEPVDLPISYVTVGPSQYLVAIDREGKIYTFSRRGVARIGLSNRSTLKCLNYFVDAGSSLGTTQLYYLDDKTAHLNKISFTDVKTMVKLNAETEHASLSFQQLDDNRSTDLLLCVGTRAMAYDFSGNLIFEKETNLHLDAASYLSDESHSLLFVFSAEAGKVICFDLLHSNEIKVDGTAAPLVKDLFKDNKQFMLVPKGRELACIPLN
jgi:hypothetical protein